MARNQVKREQDRIKRLEDRYFYLCKVMLNADQDGKETPTFLKAEASALKWAIPILKESVNKETSDGNS